MVQRPGGARPIGRPRSSGKAPQGPSPRDEIIAAATHLFAQRGYAHTSMTDIARAAGLQQSSLYYWFKRKELILQATFDVNRAPLEFIQRISAEPGSAGLKLYRLLRFDALQLCLSPADVLEVERLASQQPELFSDYWEARRDLHRWVVRLVKAGIATGEFIKVDPVLTALALLSTNEGVQRLHRTQSQHAPHTGATFSYKEYSAARFADFAAQSSLRSLLSDFDRLDALVAEGRAS